jgi:hypothetical protein
MVWLAPLIVLVAAAALRHKPASKGEANSLLRKTVTSFTE